MSGIGLKQVFTGSRHLQARPTGINTTAKLLEPNCTRTPHRTIGIRLHRYRTASASGCDQIARGLQSFAVASRPARAASDGDSACISLRRHFVSVIASASTEAQTESMFITV